jgi:ATP-dependent DNA helicase RecG
MQDPGLSSMEKRTIDLTNRLGKIKRKDVETELNISQTMAGRILKSMVDKQLIETVGRGKNTVYMLKK